MSRERMSKKGSGFRVQGSGFRVQGSGFRVQGSGFRVQGAGFSVQGAGFRIQESLGALDVEGEDEQVRVGAISSHTSAKRLQRQAKPEISSDRMHLSISSRKAEFPRKL